MNILFGPDGRQNHIPLVTAILFFVCMALLFVYLLAMRLYFPFPMAVFWAAFVAAILAIVFQITQIPWPAYERIILVEILVLNIALFTTAQIPFYSIFESDSYENMMVVKRIVDQGVVMPARPGTEMPTYAWPLLNIWGAQLHYITGITTFNIAKWLSLAMTSIFILLFYVLIKKWVRNEKAALLSILLPVTLRFFTDNRASFKSENIAIIIMVVMLYFITRTAGSNRMKFAALSIVSLFAVILAHQLTPSMLLILLVASLIASAIMGSFGSNHLSGKPTLVVTPTLVILAFIGILSYWAYLYKEPLDFIYRLGRTLLTGELGPIEGGAPKIIVLEPGFIPTIRGRIMLYGYHFFNVIFALILAYKIFSRPKDRYPEFYSFASVLIINGILVFLSQYLPPRMTVGIPNTRLYIWGWQFGFVPLVIGILENRPRWSRKVGIVLLTGFMIFNIYTIPQSRWDFQEPGRLKGDITLKEDYAVAETLTLSGQVAAYHRTRLAIYDVQGFFSHDLLGVPDINNLEMLDWVVVKKKELERYAGEEQRRRLDSPVVVDKLMELSTGNSYGGRNKIYESNNIFVLK